MNSTTVFQLAFATAVTYGMHSTLLLLAAWCIDAGGKIRSLAVRERLWKSAAIIPLLTTTVQMGWHDARPVWEYQVSANDQETAVPTVLPAVDGVTAKQEQAAVLISPRPAPESYSVVADSFDAALLTTQRRLADSRSSDGGESVHSQQPADGHDFGSIFPSQPDAAAQSFVQDPATSTGLPTLPPGPSELSVSEFDDGASVLSMRTAMVAGVGLAVIAGIALLTVDAVRLLLCLKSAVQRTEGRACALLADLCLVRQVSTKPVLLVSANCGEPSAAGFFRPAIVLPAGLESRLKTAELKVLLAHELAHLQRRDTVWLWVAQGLRCCLPWQPLNLLAVRRWRMLAEHQCDAWATEGDRIDQVTLAGVLARVVEWKLGHLPGAAVSAAGPPLSQRIDRLLNDPIQQDHWFCGWRRQVCHLTISRAVITISMFGPRLVCLKSTAAAAAAPPATVRPPVIESAGPPSSMQSADEMTLLREEFDVLAGDLETALELLAAQEEDAEITRHTAGVVEKLERLRVKLHAVDR